MRARPHCFLEGTANVKLKSHWRWPKNLAIISVYTHTVHAENYKCSLKPSSNLNENPEEKRPNTVKFIVEFEFTSRSEQESRHRLLTFAILTHSRLLSFSTVKQLSFNKTKRIPYISLKRF